MWSKALLVAGLSKIFEVEGRELVGEEIKEKWLGRQRWGDRGGERQGNIERLRCTSKERSCASRKEETAPEGKKRLCLKERKKLRLKERG